VDRSVEPFLPRAAKIWRRDRKLAIAARNAVGLYGLYCGYYLLSFLVTPYLARVLGPAGFGRFAVFQGVAMSVALLIEFGFSFSAPAALQRSPDRSDASRIVVEVMAAKGALAVMGCAAVILIAEWMPGTFDRGWLLAACLVAVLSQGFAPSWIYQGYGRLIEYSAFDMAVKAAFAIAVFVAVRRPADMQTAAALWALGSTVSTIAGLLWIGRAFEWGIVPGPREIAARLREGLTLFAFRMVTNFQAAFNPVIVGMFESGASLGVYAGCDKIAKNLSGLLYPAIEALYPYLANSVEDSSGRSRRKSQIVLGALAAAGALLSLAIYLLAPLFVKIFLGTAYGEAAGLLRILAPLPLLSAVSHSLGVHYMVPHGLGRQYFRITCGMLMLHGALAVFMINAYGITGMCYTQLVTPMISIVIMLTVILRSGLSYPSPAHSPA
jgi:PST family polysaccharide transporter